jgi:hypothetical protein
MKPVIRDRTEEHDSGPNKPRPIIQTAEGFKVDIGNPAIIEAAERALNPYFGPPATETRLLEVHAAAKAVLAAVTLLIRAQVLEEAAQTADLYTKKEMPWTSHDTAHIIAGRIRTLKEQHKEKP